MYRSISGEESDFAPPGLIEYVRIVLGGHYLMSLDNWIGDVGICKIADALLVNTNLVTLDLSCMSE